MGKWVRKCDKNFPPPNLGFNIMLIIDDNLSIKNILCFPSSRRSILVGFKGKRSSDGLVVRAHMRYPK